MFTYRAVELKREEETRDPREVSCWRSATFVVLHGKSEKWKITEPRGTSTNCCSPNNIYILDVNKLIWGLKVHSLFFFLLLSPGENKMAACKNFPETLIGGESTMRRVHKHWHNPTSPLAPSSRHSIGMRLVRVANCSQTVEYFRKFPAKVSEK